MNTRNPIAWIPILVLLAVLGCDGSGEGGNDADIDTGDDYSCHFTSCSGSTSSGANFSLVCYGEPVTSWDCNQYTNGLGQITSLSCTESPGFVSVTCNIDYDISGNPYSGQCNCYALAAPCSW